MRDMFPSPCGDYGSYHPDYILKDGKRTDEEFPSPCGDYGSYLDFTMMTISK